MGESATLAGWLLIPSVVLHNSCHCDDNRSTRFRLANHAPQDIAGGEWGGARLLEGVDVFPRERREVADLLVQEGGPTWTV